MDYLYEKGYLDPKVTPATLISAQGNLTYEDTAYMMGKVSGDLEKQVGMTHWNRKKTFARNDWWDIYRAAVEKDGSGRQHERNLCYFVRYSFQYGTGRQLDSLYNRRQLRIPRNWLLMHTWTMRYASGSEDRK